MCNSIFIRLSCFHIIFKNLLKTCRVCQRNFTKIFSDEFSKNNMLFSYQGKHSFEIISHGVFKTFCENFLSSGRNNVVNIIPACSWYVDILSRAQKSIKCAPKPLVCRWVFFCIFTMAFSTTESCFRIRANIVLK